MRQPELPALTGIRFYAATFVYLSHIAAIPGIETFTGKHLLFNAGVVAVSFFFVLSGFILTYNYADVFRNSVCLGDYKRFVWDRLTKIYPVHLLTLLFVLPIAIFSPSLPLDWRAVPFHLSLLQCFWPFSQPTFYHFLNVPSWSISCEWFFYLVAPVAMCFGVGSKRRWVLVLLMAGYAGALGWLLEHSQSAFSRLYFVSWFAPSRLVEFLAGVLLASAFLASRLRTSVTVSAVAQAMGIVVLLAGALYRQYAPWPLHGGLLYVPGSALLVLGLAHGRGFFAAHLSRRLLERLGMASFSLYMVHAPILRAVKGICFHFGWEVRSWPVFFVVVVAMFVFVQSVAWVVYEQYEFPLQRYFRRMVGRAAAAKHLAPAGYVAGSQA